MRHVDRFDRHLELESARLNVRNEGDEEGGAHISGYLFMWCEMGNTGMEGGEEEKFSFNIVLLRWAVTCWSGQNRSRWM